MVRRPYDVGPADPAQQSPSVRKEVDGLFLLACGQGAEHPDIELLRTAAFAVWPQTTSTAATRKHHLPGHRR